MLREMTEKESGFLLLSWGIGLLIAIILTKVLDKKTTNNFKIIYSKISLGTGMILTVVLLVLYVYLWIKNGINYAKSNLVVMIILISVLVTSSFGILMIIFGTFQKAKPQRFQLKQNDYEEYSNYLAKRVKEFDYELNYELEKIKFYKKEIKRKIYFIIDVKVEELTEDVFNELYNNKIFPNIEEEFEKMKNKGNVLNVIMIISVDRITPFFYKYIESEDLDKRFYKYPVGISFGSNQIYINGEEPIGYNPCKRLKQEFETITEIKENKSSD
ncbi:MAG: hypothetical protein OSJ63_04765 [Bacilli bacterium]|nr:hypothetical protein [Bacilli bacterium]